MQRQQQMMLSNKRLHREPAAYVPVWTTRKIHKVTTGNVKDQNHLVVPMTLEQEDDIFIENMFREDDDVNYDNFAAEMLIQTGIREEESPIQQNDCE